MSVTLEAHGILYERRDFADGVTITGNNVDIQNCTIGPDRWGVGLRIKGDNCHISDTLITGCGGYGIEIGRPGDKDTPTNVSVLETLIERCGAGIAIWSGRDILVEDTQILDLRWDKVVAQDADYFRAWGTDITIRGCTCGGTLPENVGPSHCDGFQTFALNGLTLHGLIFENNTVTDFGAGMQITSDDGEGAISDLVIRNNVFDGGAFNAAGKSAYGINLEDRVRNVAITQNAFLNTGIHGVFLRNFAQAKLERCLFQGSDTNWHATPDSTLIESNNRILADDDDWREIARTEGIGPQVDVVEPPVEPEPFQMDKPWLERVNRMLEEWEAGR